MNGGPETRDVRAGPGTLEFAVRLELGSAFVLESEIGRSPRSVVYRARTVSTRDLVSLKIVPQSVNGGASVDAFTRALRAVSALDHPRIVRIQGFGAASQFLWYACPYVDGESLAERLSVNGALAWKTCLRLVEEVADALEHAHRRGIAHGDLKPENVLFDLNGSCFVRDFQAAAWRADSQVEGGVAIEVGGDAWPPEVSADRDALAALVFACVTGASWASAERLRGSPRGRLRDLTGLLPQVPGYAARVLERAFSCAPGAAFASVRAFATALRNERASSPLAAAHVLLAKRDDLPEPPFHRRHQAALGVLVSVAAIGASAWLAKPGAVPDVIPATDSAQTAVPTPPEPPPVPADSPRAVPEVVTPRPRLRAGGRRAMQAPAVGFLSVSAVPWGQLYLDGVLIGNTPQLGVPVATGRHLVEVERRGFLSATREVRVAPRESVGVTDVELRRAPR